MEASDGPLSVQLLMLEPRGENFYDVGYNLRGLRVMVTPRKTIGKLLTTKKNKIIKVMRDSLHAQPISRNSTFTLRALRFIL